MSKHAEFIPEDGILSNQDFLLKLVHAKLPTVKDKKGIVYYNVPAAFDIEASSFYQGEEKHSCMYIWQFGILNWVTAGRTWEEYKRFLDGLSTLLDLSSDRRLLVYIHNFSYEFQFMRKHFEWDKLFFLESRKPIYAISGGLEYRCSFKLSGKSLENVGKDLQKYRVNKQVGLLDYNLVRLNSTPLTPNELKYAEYDIRVLLAYIMEKIEQDGSVLKIPLTNTGYVRNYCRKRCFKYYKRYRSLMSELTLDADEYSQLKRAFSGGFTHANSHHVGKIMRDVGSFDFTSSYPAVMVAEKFPMSRSRKVEIISSEEELNMYLNNYCCLFDITFINLVPILHHEHPISVSKTRNNVNVVTDNGRVVTAKQITTTITEQDFFTYAQFYTWDNMEITNFRIYEKAYLPKEFVMAILDLYEKKTVLKDVEGEEINYMISKGMINSAYGMAVTDIVRDSIEYKFDKYIPTKPDIDKAIEKYNNGTKRFLFYPWGVWVTAYARANLFTGILSCGNDYVYADTDSIKILNYENHLEYISYYNSRMLVKLATAAEHHAIDVRKFSPLTKKGVEKTLGVWDYEGVYKRFKTIGAKRYIVEKHTPDRKGNTIFLTVAGLRKESARDYLVTETDDAFDALDHQLKVPSSHSGRVNVSYLDEGCEGVMTDYLGNVGHYEELSCIHMEPSDYELTMSEDFRRFLQFIRGGKEYVD